jgi:fructose-1,6-bisphosphatase/inositol monophosphatase family enzyme
MAKKVRRVRRRAVKKETSKPPVTEIDSDAEEQILSKTDAEINGERELEEEYAYVMQDLRRVFILAAVLFVLLIALNLLLG